LDGCGREPTMARGNWRSMKRDMAGKMTSEVRGLLDVMAAVANELNATRMGIPLQSAEFIDCSQF
jgi:hypothetical protein